VPEENTCNTESAPVSENSGKVERLEPVVSVSSEYQPENENLS
jgi:hypothetical protein